MTPVELSSIFDLRESDPESWEFLMKNNSVNKTKGPFLAVGVDHPLEFMNKVESLWRCHRHDRTFAR